MKRNTNFELPTNKGMEYEPVLAVGRLTKAKLIKWINFQFKRFEINGYEVYAIEQTRYRGQDYEAGAVALHIRFRSITDHEHNDLFFSFYRIKEIEDYIKNGYTLKLSFNPRKTFSLSNMELDVCKV